jgi:nucleolar protein 15
MNNYILFDKILKCSVVQDSTKYNLLFKRWKRKFKFYDKYQNFVQERSKLKSKDEIKSHITTLLEKEEEKRKKLDELGIKYDFPGFVIYILINRNQLLKVIKGSNNQKAQK